MAVVLWVVGGVVLLAVLIGAFKTGKPLRSLFFSMVQGLCALAAVDLLSGVTGVTVGLTAFTAAVCAALGIPGVATLLVLHAIWLY